MSTTSSQALAAYFPPTTYNEVDRTLADYAENRHLCPGAPGLDNLQNAADLIAAAVVASGSNAARHNWVELVAMAGAATQFMATCEAANGGSLTRLQAGRRLTIAIALTPLAEGAPCLDQLPEEDLPVFFAAAEEIERLIKTINEMEEGPEKQAAMKTSPNWADFISNRARHERRESDLANPNVPLWGSTKPTPWARTFSEGAIDSEFRQAVDDFLREESESGQSVAVILKNPPDGIDNVGPSIARNVPAIWPELRVRGTGDGRYRRAPLLAIVAGLGEPMVRVVARQLAEGDHPGWDEVAACSDADLVGLVIEARGMAGFPLSLLRVSYPSFQALCVMGCGDDGEDNEAACGTEGGIAPSFAGAMAIVHVLRHARLMTDATTGEHSIRVIFEGLKVEIPVPREGLAQPITARINQGVLSVLASTLKINISKARNAPLIADLNRQALARLTLETLPKQLSVPANVLVPPTVTVTPDHVDRVRDWVQTGVRLPGVGEINLETGAVRPIAPRGAGPLSYNFRLSEVALGHDARISDSYLGKFPSVIPGELPGNRIINSVFRNIVTMNGRDDLSWVITALIDTWFVGNLLRTELRGSPIGEALDREFPGIFICAADVGEVQTSGQGKTTLMMLLARTLVPDIRETRTTRESGEVRQRSSAQELIRTGMLAADEFRIPEKGTGDNVFDREGLATMGTGGSVPVGQVGKNQAAAKYLFSPLICGKYFHVPRDLQMRFFPIRVGHFTPETTTDEATQESIVTGQLPKILRISGLVYCQRHSLVHLIRNAKLGTIDIRFRFPGFLGIFAVLFGSERIGEFIDGVDAIRSAAIGVAEEARRTGKLAANGQGLGVHPAMLMENIEEPDLWLLSKAWAATPTSPTAALQAILKRTGHEQANGFKALSDMLRPFNKTVHEAVAEFKGFLEKPVEINGGWAISMSLEWHPKNRNHQPRIRLMPPAGSVEPTIEDEIRKAAEPQRPAPPGAWSRDIPGGSPNAPVGGARG